MAYHSLPEFDPSAQFLATARLPIFNGQPMKPGEVLPPPPAQPGQARVYLRTVRQLFEMRKVEMVKPSAVPQSKRKEKPHGRVKV